ncbi:MAG: exonuclease SbcCD subunit D, partial [Hungatella sp.]
MRFLHTSDLHIGKVVNGFSMLEEQKYVLRQITEIAQTRRVDAVFLSGDLYDRSVPSAQAVSVLDEFLTGLIDAGIPVFAIAGNHDCGERIGFANRILEKRGLYIEGTLKDPVAYVDMESGGEPVRIHMIPYAKPVEVRAFYQCEAVTYEDAMQELLKHIAYRSGGANILLTHQFVVDHGKEPELSDSETRVSVGGADQVEAANFKAFTYTALGHIHGCQQIGDPSVCYSGSPIKYSFSEVQHQKGVILGEVQAGKLHWETIALYPLHDMRKIRGKLADLICEQVVDAADAEDYLLAVLTNEEELIDPIGTLRSVYPNVMQLQLERSIREEQNVRQYVNELKEKTPNELFEDFYLHVMGKELS